MKARAAPVEGPFDETLGRPAAADGAAGGVLPDASGAYALLIDLARPLSLPVPRLRPCVLPAGRYLYAGSARGPGGIRARVGRHLKSGKKARWHVDHLTNRAGVALVLALPGGSECAIVAAACAWPGADVPVPRFGSSDCRLCAAHLVRLPGAVDGAAELGGLAAPGTGVLIWRPPAALGKAPPTRP